jgi:uncharacterized membrane protein (UPF0127 family)
MSMREPPPPACRDGGTDRTRGDRRQALALAAALCTLACGVAAMDVDSLVIKTRDAAPHRFEVEVARTPEEHERGLMFRESMPADHGMLFDFKDPQPVTFWMKNTKLSLDMVFIGADGRVTGVSPDAVPYSQALIPSPGPVRAVLELNAGTARRLGIQAGDRVSGSVFGPPS